MNRKFEMTDIVHPQNPELRRIRALVDIPESGVLKGALGGWVQGAGNLSRYGSCWVVGDARVSGAAWVGGNAVVSGWAQVSDDAEVTGDARVCHDAQLSGNASVTGRVLVGHGARISEEAEFLQASVMASMLYQAVLYRTVSGHRFSVGCWEGTVPEFRKMVESDEWVEASPDQIRERRPELLAFTAMCEARIASWED